MKLATLAWVAFVLFSVMHALRFGNSNETPADIRNTIRRKSRPLARPLFLAFQSLSATTVVNSPQWRRSLGERFF
jgi:hypothetical protein